jgi:hypothetical protein
MVYMILENVDGVTGFWLSSQLPLIEVPTRGGGRGTWSRGKGRGRGDAMSGHFGGRGEWMEDDVEDIKTF